MTFGLNGYRGLPTQAFHRSKEPASMICELSYSIEAITRLQPTPGTTRPTYAQAMPSGITAMMPNLRGAARMVLWTSCRPRPTCSSTSNASYSFTKACWQLLPSRRHQQLQHHRHRKHEYNGPMELQRFVLASTAIHKSSITAASSTPQSKTPRQELRQSRRRPDQPSQDQTRLDLA